MSPKTRRNPGKKSVTSFKGPRNAKARKPNPKNKSGTSDSVLIYGLHAVRAALLNPKRKILSLHVTQNALDRLSLPPQTARDITTHIVSARDLSDMLGPDQVHQGIVLKTRPLPVVTLNDLEQDIQGRPSSGSVLLALDQVTDPHNVGAILRSAAVFGTAGVFMTAHHAPPLSGVLAKTASGGLEHVPVLQISNLSRALEKLARLDYQIIGLAGEGEHCLEDLATSLSMDKVVLVMGSEEKGMRRLTREKCDHLCRLKTSGPMSTLNVSNATAISLHIMATRK